MLIKTNLLKFLMLMLLVVLLLGGCSIVSSTMTPENYPTEIIAPSIYDTQTLRYNANFRIEVGDGVYWVPANTLGKPDMTRNEIKTLEKKPEILKEKIDTLYEVIEYIQAVNFKASDDNIKIEENEIWWEHHKPGEIAIITNEGNCATISNLLNYLLKDDYDEVGFIWFSEENGGHVFNYIKQNGYYFFIDLTHFRNDFMHTPIEDGNLSSYYSADFLGGPIHETKDPEKFVSYYVKNSTDTIGAFSMYIAENCTPIGNNKYKKGLFLPYSLQERFHILYDRPNDNIKYYFTDPPTIYPIEWEPYNTRW